MVRISIPSSHRRLSHHARTRRTTKKASAPATANGVAMAATIPGTLWVLNAVSTPAAVSNTAAMPNTNH